MLHFAAIDIENPVVEIHIWLTWGLNQQELVVTDAQLTVREGLDLSGRQVHCLCDTVDDDKIVTKAMHFRER